MSERLGEKVRDMRKMQGFTLKKLSELSGVSPSRICAIENHVSCRTTTYTIRALASALGVTSQYLMGEGSLHDKLLMEAFFKKFQQLTKDNQGKVRQIIEIWSE